LGLTVIYSIRLAFGGFVNFRGNSSFSSLCDTDYTLSIPILILTSISLLSGPVLRWTLFTSPSLILLPLYLKMGALLIISIAILITLRMVNFNLNLLNRLNKFSIFNGKI